MEFLKLLHDLFEKKDVTKIKDSEKLTETFLSYLKSDDGKVKYQQLSYILQKSNQENFVLKIYNGYKNKVNMSDLIEEIVTEFDLVEISPAVYTYFIHAALKALNVEVDDFKWIHPCRNTLDNESMGKDFAFGCGLYNESLEDYEIIENELIKSNKAKKYLTIPKGVRAIRNDALSGMKSVEFISIPDSIAFLTADTLRELTLLNKVILPQKISSIPKNFFKNCANLEVVLASGLNEVEESAFESTKITSIENFNGSNLEILGKNAFKACFDLKTIQLKKLKEVHETPFYNCINVSEVTITINDDLINNRVHFYQLFEQKSKDMSNYSFLKTINVNVPNGIIPEGFFENCSTVTNIKINGEIDRICPKAFKGCTLLEELVLDFKGDVLESSLFEGCTNLVKLPKLSNVEYIKENVFKGCTLLEEISFDRTILELSSGCFQNCSKLQSLNIKLAVDTLPEYCLSGCIEIFDFSFLSNIKIINSYALQGIEFPHNFIFPSKLADISSHAFDKCIFNKYLTLPKDCRIDEKAFSNIETFDILYANNLEIINTNNQPIEIYQLFENDIESFNTKFQSLTTIKIDVEIVGESVFKGWKNITNVSFSEKLEEIKQSSFENCTNLETINVKSKNVILNENAFKDCVSLVNVLSSNSSNNSEKIFDLSFCSKIEPGSFANCDCSEIYLSINKDTSNDAFFISRIFGSDFSNIKLKTININCIDGTLIDKLFENCITTENIKINGVVKVLNENLFSGCANLTNLEMEYDGNIISNNCFANCSDLIKFPIFTNVKIIGEQAFFGCASLKNITFSKRIDEIGAKAFENCSALESISMEFYGKYLKKDTFSGCNNLKDFHFIKGIEVFESNCLANLNLTNKFMIPENVKTICQHAFNGSTLDNELIINSNINYQSDCFTNTKGITKIIFNELKIKYQDEIILPYMLFASSPEEFSKKFAIDTISLNSNKIVEESFKNWKNLKYVSFSHKVESLPYSCFEGCTNLEEVNLPYYNMNLGENTFSNCTNLSKVTFENNFIENNEKYLLPLNVYKNCNKLEEIYIYLNDYILKNNLSLSSYFADSDEEFYKNLTKLKSVVIINKIKEIPTGFFKNCRRLTNIKILNEVNKMNEGVFENCVMLEDIDINYTGQALSDNLFSGCTNLENIFNYDNVNYIGDYAFSNCIKLSNLNFSKDIVYIGKNTFDGCTNLQAINLNYIGEKLLKETFLNCKKLTKTPHFTNLEYLDETSFLGCIELKIVYLTAIKNANVHTLFSKLKLEKLYYNSVDIPDYFFKDVCNVEEVIFEQKIKSIGDYAFENCKNIPSINNIDEIEFIGDYAFKNSNIETIKLPDTIPSYGIGLFSNCYELKEVEMPSRFDFIGAVFSSTEDKLTKQIVQLSTGIEKKYFIPSNLNKIIINSGDIVTGAFSNLDVELVINVKLSKIKPYTFYNCKNVSFLDMSQVTSIEDNAFTNTIVDSLELPNIISIGNDVFKGANVKLLNLGNKINSIKKSSFDGFKFENFQIKSNEFYKIESSILIDLKKSTILNVFDCSEDLVIPKEITLIESNAFVNKNLKSVDTNNVKVIKTKSFINCNLEKVKFKNVEKFETNILSNCKNVSSLELPFIGEDANTSKNIDHIFDFEKTEFDEIIVLGGVITPITFRNIKNINNLDLGHVNVKSLDESLFKGINIKKLILPTALNEIKENSFNHVLIDEVICESPNVKYEENCIFIDDKLIYCTHEKIDMLVINDSVNSISKNAFQMCNLIENIELLNKSISYSGLFDQIKSINRLSIVNLQEKLYQIFKKSINSINEIVYIDYEIAPNFLSNIDYFEKLIFKHYNALNFDMFISDKDKRNVNKKKIVINELSYEDTLENLESDVFDYLTLNNLEVRAGERYSTENNLLYDLEDKKLIYASKGISGEVVVPGFINYIKEYSFANCPDIENIKLMNILEVGKCSFENCSKLSTLVVSDNCQKIGDTILRKCDKFEYIELPFVGESNTKTSNLEYLFGNKEFSKDINVLKITNQNIIDKTFNNHNNIHTIILGSSVTQIKEGSFVNCKKLNKIYLNQNIAIEDFAFRDCNRFTKVYVSKKNMKNFDKKWNKLSDKKIFSTLKVVNKKTKHEIYG